VVLQEVFIPTWPVFYFMIRSSSKVAACACKSSMIRGAAIRGSRTVVFAASRSFALTMPDLVTGRVSPLGSPSGPDETVCGAAEPLHKARERLTQ
jgi:hypothetical protein